MANKLANEIVISSTGDGVVKVNVEDLVAILSGTAPSGLGSDDMVIKLDLPTSNPGAGILWADSGTVKVGT